MCILYLYCIKFIYTSNSIKVFAHLLRCIKFAFHHHFLNDAFTFEICVCCKITWKVRFFQYLPVFQLKNLRFTELGNGSRWEKWRELSVCDLCWSNRYNVPVVHYRSDCIWWYMMVSYEGIQCIVYMTYILYVLHMVSYDRTF